MELIGDDLEAAYFLAHRFVEPMRAAGRPVSDAIERYTRKVDLAWKMSASGPENTATAVTSEHESCDSAEAAQIIGVTERHVRRLADEGDLVGRKFGTAWVLSRQSVMDYAEGRQDGGIRPGRRAAAS